MTANRFNRTEFSEDLELSYPIKSYPTVIVSVTLNYIMAEWYLDVYDSYAKEHFNKSLWITAFVYVVV